MKAPAFQFYPSDYLSSQRVQLLTLEEEGAYLRLLCFCWKAGAIPKDPSEAARLVGKGASTTLVTKVLPMFNQHPTNGCLLVHERLEIEREKQAKWREKSAEGGKKSAKKRAEKRAPASDSSRVVQPPCQPKGNSSTTSSLSSSTSDCGSGGAVPTPPDGGVAAPNGASLIPPTAGKKRSNETDQEWLDGLQKKDAYSAVKIMFEFQKAQTWCEINNRKCSRKFFVNWINRTAKEAPMKRSDNSHRHGEYPENFDLEKLIVKPDPNNEHVEF